MNKYNNDESLITSISNGISEYADNKKDNISIPLQYIIRRHVTEFISNRFIKLTHQIDIQEMEQFDNIIRILESIVK